MKGVGGIEVFQRWYRGIPKRAGAEEIKDSVDVRQGN